MHAPCLILSRWLFGLLRFTTVPSSNTSAFPPFNLPLLHIVLFLHVLRPLCRDLVSSFSLFFSPVLPHLPVSVWLLLFPLFCSLLNSLSLCFALFICLAPPLSHLCQPAVLLSFLLSRLRSIPLPVCPSGIACLRAHGGVCCAPSRLTQCSLLPASICRSSGPHRPAQRAGWGAGKRQSLPEPAQDWISGYTHTLTLTQWCMHALVRTHTYSLMCSLKCFNSKFWRVKPKAWSTCYAHFTVVVILRQTRHET